MNEMTGIGFGADHFAGFATEMLGEAFEAIGTLLRNFFFEAFRM